MATYCVYIVESIFGYKIGATLTKNIVKRFRRLHISNSVYRFLTAFEFGFESKASEKYIERVVQSAFSGVRLDPETNEKEVFDLRGLDYLNRVQDVLTEMGFEFTILKDPETIRVLKDLEKVYLSEGEIVDVCRAKKGFRVNLGKRFLYNPQKFYKWISHPKYLELSDEDPLKEYILEEDSEVDSEVDFEVESEEESEDDSENDPDWEP